MTAAVHESETGSLPYRLFTPSKIPEDTQVPLVIFLHGAGERGIDNQRQLRHGVSAFVSADAQAQHPCILVAPQCPRGEYWPQGNHLDLCFELIDELLSKHPIHPHRIYVTGLSMGGYGTWYALARRPDLFAAALPICGGGQPKDAEKFAHVPIWAFHGDADGTVRPEQSRRMVAAVRKAGGGIRYTEYAGVRHNSWTRTYSNPAVRAWLFSHRKDPDPIEPMRLDDGERIVFFGDSITQAGAKRGGYIRRIEAAHLQLEDHAKVEWIGAGISGHKVPNLLQRLQRDVISKRPTRVFIYIGINDVWHWNRKKGTPIDKFEAGLRELVAKITEQSDARVILCTPSVIGEKTDGSNRFDAMLEDYSAVTRRVASETASQLLDLRRAFTEYLAANNPENLAKGILTTDGVHLNATGNQFVADQMIIALDNR